MEIKKRQPLEKEIYIWNIIGSMANALFSVIILMLVTRTVSENHADIFSVAWSISQLMVIIGTFQIRTYQATDVNGKYTFKQYFDFRMITIIIMMVCSLIYVWAKSYDIYKACIVFVMCLLRAVEALSDVYEGWFQQKERLDLAGKVIAYRVMISLLVFGGTLVIVRNLLVSCIVLLLCYLASFVFFNIRYIREVDRIDNHVKPIKNARWILDIFSEGLPIFINAFLMMSIMNAPKMAIDTSIEQGLMIDGMQTVFNVLFMPASFINLAYIVFRPMITKMAIVWNMGRKRELVSILMKIEVCLLGIGLALMAGGSLLGIPVLSLVYGIDLNPYKGQLLTIIAGGCFYTIASVFDNALVAMRKHRVLLVAYIITWIYIQIVANNMVQTNGVAGATMAYTSAMLLFLVLAIVLFVLFFIRNNDKEEHEEKHEKVQKQ